MTPKPCHPGHRSRPVGAPTVPWRQQCAEGAGSRHLDPGSDPITAREKQHGDTREPWKGAPEGQMWGNVQKGSSSRKGALDAVINSWAPSSAV